MANLNSKKICRRDKNTNQVSSKWGGEGSFKCLLILFLFLIISISVIFIVFALPTITFVSPTFANNSYTNNNWVFVNLTSDENLNQSLLEWGNSSGFTNVSMSNNSLTNWYKNMTNLVDYNYNYTIWAQNTSGNWSQSARYFVTVDTVYPWINFTNPTPSSGSTQANANIFVNVSANDTQTDISTFIDFDNSLVSWWRMDDVNSTTGVIDYMGRNNGTRVNATQTDAGKLGKGMSFNGNGNYVYVVKYPPTDNQIFNFTNSTDFTVSVWVKPLTKGASNYIVSNNYGTSAGFRLELDNGVTFRFKTETSGIATTFSVPVFDTWYYVVGTKNSTGGYLYINGTLKSSDITLTGNYLGYPSLTIGGYVVSPTTSSFNGTIDDVMIFNRSLSAEEIAGLYANQSNRYLGINYIGLNDGNHTFKAYAQDLGGNVNSTEQRIVTISSDTQYPQFSNYWDNNASLLDIGTGNFNVTIENTNGTVVLHIDGTDILATNHSSNGYNASHTFTQAGTYLYNWTAYGNGTLHNLNTSENRYYTVNISISNITINSPKNNSLTDLNVTLNFSISGPGKLNISVYQMQGHGDDLLLSFAQASEIHWGQLSYSLDCNNTMGWINNENVNYTFIAGDVAMETNVSGAKDCFANLSMPYAVTNGNHDAKGNETNWTDYFLQVPYSFDYQGYHIIMLDTYNVNGDLTTTQETWLSQDLNITEKPIFIITHIDKYGLSEYSINDTHFQSIINKTNVKVVMVGHNHNDDLCYNTLDNNVVCFDGHIGGSFGTDKGYRLYKLYKNGTMVSDYIIGVSQTHRDSYTFNNIPILIGNFTDVTSNNFSLELNNLDLGKEYAWKIGVSNGADVIFSDIYYFNTYTPFSNEWDDSGSLTDTGTGHFNVTVANTNGTVILHINGTDVYATNLSSDNYNVSYTFSHGGTYEYNWTAYGDGLNYSLITSNNRYYTVNASVPDIHFTSPTPDNASTQSATSIYVNVTANATSDVSTFIDFDNSLITWWRMDDVSGFSLTDYLGINNGTIYGQATQTTGKLGKGFSFDGDMDYVEITDSQIWNFTNSTDFTISVWVKPQQMSVTAYILSNNYGSERGWSLYLDNGVKFKFMGETDGWTVSATSNIPVYNVWYYIVVTKNSTEADLYINGSLNKNDTTIGDFIGHDSLTIGGYTLGPLLNNFNGTIDDAMIFNRSLSAEEIQAIYVNTSQKYLGVNFTGLAEGNHTFKAYAQDLGGNVNSTEQRIVTISSDTQYPQFSNNLTSVANGSQYNLNNNYQFNITIANTNGTAGIEFNGTNYTLSNVSNSFYWTAGNLGVGTYSYYYWAYGNDSSNLFNSSLTYSYTIIQATPILTFLANGGTSNLTLIYPQQINISATSNAGTVGLDKDNVNYLSNNGLNITLGVGSYIFRANITGNQNYSNVGYSYYNITINRGSSVVYTYLNNSRANITITNGTSIWLNATRQTGEGIIELYNNGTLINSGNSPLSNLTNFTNVGLFNITAIYPATQNYSSSYETWWVNVTNVTNATSTPTTSPTCGDGTCNGIETCSSCSSDCGSCGGGGAYVKPSWDFTYANDYSELKNLPPLLQSLEERQRVLILVDSEKHYVGVTDISGDKVTINVSSDAPKQAILRPGETAKFEINNDSYYGIKILLNNIYKILGTERANLTISYIHERIPKDLIINNQTISTNLTANQTKSDKCGIGEEKNLGVCIKDIIGNPALFFVAFLVIFIIWAVYNEFYKKKKY